jgi:hypothetical protein
MDFATVVRALRYGEAMRQRDEKRVTFMLHAAEKR